MTVPNLGQLLQCGVVNFQYRETYMPKPLVPVVLLQNIFKKSTWFFVLLYLRLLTLRTALYRLESVPKPTKITDNF